METWGVVFLGIIALTSVVQAAFLIGLARAGRRLGQRVDALQRRIDEDLRPGLDHLTRLTRNLAEISDLAALQTQRVSEVLSNTLDRVEETTELVQRLVLRPLAPLAEIVAFIKGLRRGLEAYRELGGVSSESRATVRRYQDDEHLFI
jgi:hypothetical protein